MKKAILTLILLGSLITMVLGQSRPRKIITHDTVKTVRENVSYAPDTIAIYFKEIKPGHPNVSGSVPYEQWVEGYVVWQTYKKSQGYTFIQGNSGTWGAISIDTSVYALKEYYTDRFEPSKPISGIFLYSDRTRVKNPVIYTIKK